MKYTVTRHGALVDPNGQVFQFDPSAPIVAPRVYKPFQPYISPVSGKLIEDHASRKEDLKRHGCVEAGDRKPVEIKNEERRRRYLAPARD